MIERYTRPEMAGLWTDDYRFKKMLQVELLASEALVKQKKVPAAALARIKSRARIDVSRIREIEKTVKHDVIAFVTQVAESVGEDAKRYLHFGLTSSDVLDTALAIQMVEAADLLLAGLGPLQKTVGVLARKHEKTLMIGRSHGIHGEPVTFGFKVAGWYSELGRAKERLRRARDVAAYGKLSGAMGTFAHLDPSVEAYVCKKLGLKPEPAATQVVPRDRHAEYVCQLAVVAAGLERITEIRHLQRTEVLEVEEPFSKDQKGSSAMPHKRNPIACENICGLARLIRSHSLAAQENVALWHERDISHSSVERVILPDTTILLDFMIARLHSVLLGLNVYPANMKRNMAKTVEISASQRLLLALVDKGVNRDEAYRKVQTHAMQAWQTGDSFRALIAADPEFKKRLTTADLDRVFDPAYYVRHVKDILKRVGL